MVGGSYEEEAGKERGRSADEGGRGIGFQGVSGVNNLLLWPLFILLLSRIDS